MSDTPASAQPLPISWISRVYSSWYDQQAQQAVEGWVLTYTWNPTGTVITTKIPAASYTPANVYNSIKAAGAQDEQIHGLGG